MRLQDDAVGALLALPAGTADAVAATADGTPGLDALFASHLLRLLLEHLGLGLHGIGLDDDGLVLLFSLEQHLCTIERVRERARTKHGIRLLVPPELVSRMHDSRTHILLHNVRDVSDLGCETSNLIGLRVRGEELHLGANDLLERMGRELAIEPRGLVLRLEPLTYTRPRRLASQPPPLTHAWLASRWAREIVRINDSKNAKQMRIWRPSSAAEMKAKPSRTQYCTEWLNVFSLAENERLCSCV